MKGVSLCFVIIFTGTYLSDSVSSLFTYLGSEEVN